MFAAARVVVTFGVILQFAGFGKLLIIADYFGAGATLDAYYLALVAPTFLASISAGILQSSFVPEYIRVRATGGPALAQHVRNYALTWTVVVLTMVSVLASCLPPSVLSILSHGSGPQVHRQLEVAFSVLIWSTPVSGFADAGAMLLNAEGRFFAAASAPVANVAISVLTLLCWPQTTIDALIWSLLAGVAAQALVVAAALYRAGLSVRPSFAVPERLSRALTHIALPVIVSSVLADFIPAFIQVAAARAGPGAVSAMGYASRLHNSLVQAVVMSVSVVLLPHFARLTAERREAGVAGVRWSASLRRPCCLQLQPL